MSPPAFYDFHIYRRLGAALVQVRRFFLYLTIFLICSASQIGCFSFVTFLVTVVRFPLFRSPVSPPGVTQNNDRSGFFPSPPPSHCHSREVRTVFICFPISNVFKVCRGPSHLGFRGCINFPWGRAYKYTACIFTSTCFRIPG